VAAWVPRNQAKMPRKIFNFKAIAPIKAIAFFGTFGGLMDYGG
jgi:hypothetical protein